MKIYLIGYMGSGKTTIGRPLAKALKIPFVDIDRVISEKYSRSINDIFSAEGEGRFREMERDALEEVSGAQDVVVSTGGGAPCFFDNMEFMNGQGVTIYLKVSPEGLARRLEHGIDKRPLLRGKSAEELVAFIGESLESRREHYEKAHMTVDCDGYSDAMIVDRIVNMLNLTN